MFKTPVVFSAIFSCVSVGSNMELHCVEKHFCPQCMQLEEKERGNQHASIYFCIRGFYDALAEKMDELCGVTSRE